jgi:photosystem II stability/assembly factor-like uncharacterized protein
MINLFILILLSSTILSSACETNHAASPNKSLSTEALNIAQVRSAAFLGPSQAWLVDDRHDKLWRTSDGGKTWDTVSGKAIGGEFWATTFIDSKRGWAANYEGQIWRTHDGGTTWTLISQPRGGPDNKSPYLPRQIVFVDEYHGWLVDNWRIWRTDDGGSNWERTSTTNEVDGDIWKPTRMTFIDANLGWVSATNGIVHRTTDGGATWQSRKLILGDADATDVFFLNKRVGWLTGFVSSSQILSGTRLYRTDDGGETWQPVAIADRDTYIKSVWFTGEKQGWAIGSVSKTGEPSRGTILFTHDGGKSWREKVLGLNASHFDRIYFVNSTYGWLFAENNIYRTQDGEKSWDSVLKVTPIQYGD